jgi:hypothetical protein
MGSQAGAKRVLDIEDAIKWACAEELPKKRPAAASALPRLGALLPRHERTVVGPWTRPAGFPEISPMFARGYSTGSIARSGRGGEPDPDALAIEAAILALVGPALLTQGLEEAVVSDIRLPVDAEGALAASFANAANLVLAHGRLGTRPDTGHSNFAVHAKLAPNGKPGVWRTERLTDPLGGERDYENPVKAIRRDLYPEGAFCRIEFEPDPQLVVNDRADYCAWRLALEALAEALSGKLARIAALPPAAALLPWTGEKDGDRPRGLFSPGAERLYSAGEAAMLAVSRARGERRPIGPARQMARARRPAKPAKAMKS